MHFWANKTPQELLVKIVKKIHSKFSFKKPVYVENAAKFLNNNMICSPKFAKDLVSWLFQLYPETKYISFDRNN
jgi:hypothetical protein